MSELAQVRDVRECCGERYPLVEQQRGSLVRRWYAHADDSEQRPLAAHRRCATPLLPRAATGPNRAPARVGEPRGRAGHAPVVSS